MARLSIPTGDAGSVFEAFDPNRNNLSGAIATISLELESRARTMEAQHELSMVFGNTEFQDRLYEAAEARVKKGLGDGYSIEVYEFEDRTLTVNVRVGTLYDETSSAKATAKGVADVAAQISRDLRMIMAEHFDLNVRVRPSWDAEKGLTAPLHFLAPDTPAPELEEHRSYLRARRATITGIRAAVVVMGCIAVGLLLLFLAIRSHGGTIAVVSLYAGLISVIALVVNRMLSARVSELDDDIREAGNELDLRRIGTDEGEARAQKLFQSHAFEIKRYYDQALRQGRSIYYVGLICIGLGFAVIGAAFALISGADSKDLSGQIIVGVLGAIGGILANFIAVVYLRMFSETVQALTSFHQRLVITHHLHFGNFLASKIQDGQIREAALAEMSTGLSMAASGNASPGTHQGNGSEPEGWSPSG